MLLVKKSKMSKMVFVPKNFTSERIPNERQGRDPTTASATVDAIDAVASSVQAKLPTGVLNRTIETATKKTSAPMRGGKRLKVYYGLQVGTDPLTIRLFVNDPKLMTDAYRSYLEKALRARFGLEGAPVRLFLKARSRKDGAQLGIEIDRLKKNSGAS